MSSRGTRAFTHTRTHAHQSANPSADPQNAIIQVTHATGLLPLAQTRETYTSTNNKKTNNNKHQ